LSSSCRNALDRGEGKRKSLEHECPETFDDASHRGYWSRSRHHFQW